MTRSADAPNALAEFEVPDAALTWRFVRAGGPGGQHVNKVATKVELDCDVEACGFPQDVRDRIVAALGPVIRVVAGDTRSQRRNRELALERVHAALASAATPQKRRRPTKPTKASAERRLDAKRRAAQRKRSRSERPDD